MFWFLWSILWWEEEFSRGWETPHVEEARSFHGSPEPEVKAGTTLWSRPTNNWALWILEDAVTRTLPVPGPRIWLSVWKAQKMLHCLYKQGFGFRLKQAFLLLNPVSKQEFAARFGGQRGKSRWTWTRASLLRRQEPVRGHVCCLFLFIKKVLPPRCWKSNPGWQIPWLDCFGFQGPVSLLLIVNSIFLKSFSVCSASLGQTLVGKIKLGLGWGKTEAIKQRG